MPIGDIAGAAIEGAIEVGGEVVGDLMIEGATNKRTRKGCWIGLGIVVLAVILIAVAIVMLD